jgi:hypothetical protein
LAKEKKC